MIISELSNEFVIKEEIHSSPEHIWKYLTESKLLKKWWGPKGWKTTIIGLEEPRKGLTWKYHIELIKGFFCATDAWFSSTCIEIVPYRLIKTEDIFIDANGERLPDTPKMLITITLEKIDDETTIVSSRTEFKTTEGMELAKDHGIMSGMNEGFETLKKILNDGR